MRHILTCLIFVIAFLPLFRGDLIAGKDSQKLNGPYLGQKPPGMVPEIFAADIISTQKNEINSVFTPDGKEFYFSIFNPGKGYTIMVMKEENSGWTKPQVAPFSGKYSEVDMFITPDGKQFYYISKRPLKKNGSRSAGYQVWVMERQNQGWSTPRNLGPVINSGDRQLYPTLTRNGTIYFGSNREGYGGADIFRSQYLDGKYTEPENLGESINTKYNETDVFVAPDEGYIIFTSSDRPDGFGGGDHYISFRRTNGSWTKAKNMGEKFNTSSSEFCPMLSQDGKYFFFTSGRKGSDDIYWVDASVILEFKPNELK